MAEKKTVQEAIKEIILKLRGKDIFKNMKQFWALLDDLAPECVKERKMIKRSLDEELLAVFIDESKTVKHRIKILLDNFDDLGVKEDCADFIIESFGMPLGWNQEIREMKLNRPVTPPSMLSPTSGKVSYADIVLNEDTLKHLGIIDKKTLTTVNIPASFNTYVGTVYRITKIDDNIFKDCDKLETVVIPDTVTEIGNNAFNGCKSLRNINVPNDVTRIGNGAFCGCSALEKIIIPNNVTEIGDEAFKDCEVLENVILPDSLTKIGCVAFANCKSFTNIIIPNNATDVSLSAFLGCDNIDQFTLPIRLSSFYHFYRYDGYSCSNVDLDKNILEQLGYEVIYGSYGNSSQTLSIKKNDQEITELNIPPVYYYSGRYYRITGISDWCFGGSQLTKVVIPDSVTWIGNYAFERSLLTDIVISNSVQTIYSHAFEYSNSLTNITIPKSVTRINDYAFQNCSNLILSVPTNTYIEHSDAYRGIKELKRY